MYRLVVVASITGTHLGCLSRLEADGCAVGKATEHGEGLQADDRPRGSSPMGLRTEIEPDGGDPNSGAADVVNTDMRQLDPRIALAEYRPGCLFGHRPSGPWMIAPRCVMTAGYSRIRIRAPESE